LLLRRALVTCDDDNVGSAKVIERCGGVLESLTAGHDGSVPTRRYWVKTGA
jgi:predicted acetyltransferase